MELSMQELANGGELIRAAMEECTENFEAQAIMESPGVAAAIASMTAYHELGLTSYSLGEFAVHIFHLGVSTALSAHRLKDLLSK